MRGASGHEREHYIYKLACEDNGGEQGIIGIMFFYRKK